jgi:uncharacterized protein YbgA (DUF1722 family)/uncharacterized protein YbbK (DUF523 family)
MRMPEHLKPVVVLSRCLDLEPVRYDGQVVPYDFVRQLEPWVEYRPVCPEVEIGLGVPRDPIRIVELHGRAHLIQPDTGADYSEDMKSFADEFLNSLGAVDGFILKSRSPSCGIKDTKIFQGSHEKAPSTRGAGFFGARAKELYPGLAVEDEERLRDYMIREHFLTKLFSLARFRSVKGGGSMRRLAHFQSVNELLLMAYNQKEMRTLGRIAANSGNKPFAELIGDYERHLQAAFKRAPRYTSVINVLQHAAGYFTRQLSSEEKAIYGSSLDKYRTRQVPVSVVSSILRSWIVRFGEEYLATQTFFDPYPATLIA